MKTQKDWIKEQLLTKGRVTRNECLRRYITRAASRILELKDEGYKITGKPLKTDYGEDFEYILEDKQLTLWQQ